MAKKRIRKIVEGHRMDGGLTFCKTAIKDFNLTLYAEDGFVQKLRSVHGGNPVSITCPCCGTVMHSTDWAYAGTGKRCDNCRVKLAGDNAFIDHGQMKTPLPPTTQFVEVFEKENPYFCGWAKQLLKGKKFEDFDLITDEELANLKGTDPVIVSKRSAFAHSNDFWVFPERRTDEGDQIRKLPTLETLLTIYNSKQ